MSQRLIVLDEAEDELIEAEKWYERQRSGLGREFRTAIDEGMERLLKAPLAASPMECSRLHWCPANFCQTVSLFDRLHRTRRGSLGCCVCPSQPATRLLARTTETVAGSRPKWCRTANHWIEKDSEEHASHPKRSE